MAVSDRPVDLSWERFAAEVAAIIGASSSEIAADQRIVEDLGFDSLALAELVMVLIGEYETEDLSRSLDERTWLSLTVGQMYEECGAIASAQGRRRPYKFTLEETSP